MSFTGKEYLSVFFVPIAIGSILGIYGYYNTDVPLKRWNENITWDNWPSWLKGIFVLWPSFYPMLFFFKTIYYINVDESFASLDSLVNMIFFALGLWMINFVILGSVWILLNIIAFYGKKKSRGSKRTTDIDETENGSRPKKERTVIEKKKKILRKKEDK